MKTTVLVFHDKIEPTSKVNKLYAKKLALKFVISTLNIPLRCWYRSRTGSFERRRSYRGALPGAVVQHARFDEEV